MDIQYEVISKYESIKAGEIRVEFEPYSDFVSISRYSRNLYLSSKTELARMDINRFLFVDLEGFLEEVKRKIVIAHVKVPIIRITEEVYQFFLWQ